MNPAYGPGIDTELSGRLLVATPELDDGTFDRSVVLLLDHDENGALGVVVNHPTPVDVAEVLPSWQPLACEPGVLFKGGPVALDSASIPRLARPLPSIARSRKPFHRLPTLLTTYVAPAFALRIEPVRTATALSPTPCPTIVCPSNGIETSATVNVRFAGRYTVPPGPTAVNAASSTAESSAVPTGP